VHPPGRAKLKDIFLLGGRDLEVHVVPSDCLLKATTKKGRQLFLRKKVHPQTNF